MALTNHPFGCQLHSVSCLFSFQLLRRAVGQNEQILFGWRHANSEVIIAFSDLFAGTTGY
jgi:hypothetical protein